MTVPERWTGELWSDIPARGAPANERRVLVLDVTHILEGDAHNDILDGDMARLILAAIDAYATEARR